MIPLHLVGRLWMEEKIKEMNEKSENIKGQSWAIELGPLRVDVCVKGVSRKITMEETDELRYQLWKLLVELTKEL